MKKIKVLLDFGTFTVAFLIEFARNIVTMMTGNTTFGTPFITLTTITNAINDLEVKFKAGLNGDKQQKANVRIAFKLLVSLLKKQAAYVNTIADGNDAIILSSGFHTSNQPSPKHLDEFSIDNGEKSGETIAKHKAVKGAKSYIWQRANDTLPANDSGWAYVGFTTVRKYTDSGLTPTNKYWYRVAWITKEGLSAWSDPLMIIAK